ncbi:alpha/beta hydrolase [Arthrobacter sp. JSM 101049]|uniref:alpha/beta hydrolase n=1 Tax=Arthrobacter sp. JSM 101049 TaxID=929097 RepID=UPI00356A7B4F
MTFRSRRLQWVAAFASCLLLLSACSTGQSADPGTEPDAAASMPAAPEGLERYYTQSLDWTSCSTSFECADVEVPLDYAHPEGDSIQLAVVKMEAPGKAQGTLLVNPGGPGGSGVDLVMNAGSLVFSEDLRGAYDVLGFDPRGVSRSAPVTCRTDAERDEARTIDIDTSTAAGLAELEAQSKDFAQDCARKTGKSLGFVDTVSSAKDMDILRAVSGDPKLDYLGFSYGTKLGATYAQLFPQSVGHMVLDGAMDPSLDNEEVTLGQAAAFEKAITTYLEDCLRRQNCPFDGDVDQARSQLQQLFDSVEKYPMTAQDGREVGITDFVNGFLLAFYDDAYWDQLTAALNAVISGDPTKILEMADMSAGRNADGTYTGNSTAAFTAINCLDYPVDTSIEGQRRDARELAKASPTIGKYLAFGGMACQDWKYEPTGHPAPVSAPGAAPIVIIGTTGDPATPYQWSKALNQQLESSVLLTFHGQGHTAYGRSNECIGNAVDDYFVDSTVPQDGLQC